MAIQLFLQQFHLFLPRWRRLEYRSMSQTINHFICLIFLLALIWRSLPPILLESRDIHAHRSVCSLTLIVFRTTLNISSPSATTKLLPQNIRPFAELERLSAFRSFSVSALEVFPDKHMFAPPMRCFFLVNELSDQLLSFLQGRS